MFPTLINLILDSSWYTVRSRIERWLHFRSVLPRRINGAQRFDLAKRKTSHSNHSNHSNHSIQSIQSISVFTAANTTLWTRLIVVHEVHSEVVCPRWSACTCAVAHILGLRHRPSWASRPSFSCVNFVCFCTVNIFCLHLFKKRGFDSYNVCYLIKKDETKKY